MINSEQSILPSGHGLVYPTMSLMYISNPNEKENKIGNNKRKVKEVFLFIKRPYSNFL